MNDIMIRQFALDIERNAREVERLTKQVKRLRRRTLFCGVLAAGAIGYAVFLDKYVEKELRAKREYEESRYDSSNI